MQQLLPAPQGLADSTPSGLEKTSLLLMSRVLPIARKGDGRGEPRPEHRRPRSDFSVVEFKTTLSLRKPQIFFFTEAGLYLIEMLLLSRQFSFRLA